jgi:hypothetical protein
MADRVSYRPAELPALIGLKRTKVGELLSSGEIESFVVGRARLVTRASIERWASRREQLAKRTEAKPVQANDPTGDPESGQGDHANPAEGLKTRGKVAAVSKPAATREVGRGSTQR